MGHIKGTPKTGGRKKGTPNKVTATCREVCEQALGMTIPEKLIQLAGQVPQRQIDVLIKLMDYTYPKLTAMQVSGSLSTGEHEPIDYKAELDAAVSRVMQRGAETSPAGTISAGLVRNGD